MTEKEALQARHRAESAEARNRVKERKARTRRLIQEKVFSQASTISLENLEAVLRRKLSNGW